MERASDALEEWMTQLTDLDERQQIVVNLQDRLNRMMLQIQMEGQMSIHDFGVLNYIAQTWKELITVLALPKCDDNKRKAVNLLFKLYKAYQISSNLFVEIMLQM